MKPYNKFVCIIRDILKQKGADVYMDSMAVRAIRIKLGYTQEQFAAQLGVSRSLIANVEAGLRAVSLKLQIKIAQFVGIGDEIIEAIERARHSVELA